jgi:hypothetical protein
MFQNKNVTLDSRESVAGYLSKLFCKIFEAGEGDEKIIYKNLLSMDDATLQRELDLIDTYYRNVKHAYTNAVTRMRQEEEALEESVQPSVSFNF